ncbi:FMN-binding negative transcriptional regulator [uncultured Abyssibacter sp.]|uniref:FMN-binding negative transcriptional regulator n=1 Tax=uncultured Abyssibacter sp. TaxID=2320202 RepID=UPI0032B1FF1B|tara:strand:+ start:731 stop:1351 length:621 start_codon:yes stop_codon:yes gene_type:complete
MWTPAPFEQPELKAGHDLVRRIRLGTVVTAAPLNATPVPFYLDGDRGTGGTLVGHLARANRHCEALATGPEVLVSFTGPQTYVSAEWYVTQPRVSTWYYAAAHVHGCARLIESPEAVRAILDRSFAAFGSPDSNWRPDPTYVDRLLPAIVGLEIDIERIEAQQRYGQDGPPADQTAVFERLRDGGPGDREIASWMRDAPGSALSPA